MSSLRVAALALALAAVSFCEARAEREGPTEDVRRLARGTKDFAFDLHRAIPKGDGNLFFSPYGISEAMAMAASGARGETAKELHAGMRFGIALEKTPRAFRDLSAEVRRGTSRRWPNAEPLRFHVANGLWAQDGFPLREEYVRLLREAFQAEARTADFAAAAETARNDINGWVREKTEKRIPELLGGGVLGPDTLLVLVNAIWFKATWRRPFDPGRTKPAAFTRLDGSQVEVPTMHIVETFRYGRGDDWELVELPYALSHAAMTILLPAPGALPALEARLDGERLEALRSQARSVPVRLALPKIRLRSKLTLSDALASMGMASAFGGGADFGGMSATERLFIAEVVHEAMLEVDEYGTEAAAATAVVMDKGREAEPVDVRVDRPFLVLIHNTTTGAVLFFGRVADPQAGG